MSEDMYMPITLDLPAAAPPRSALGTEHYNGLIIQFGTISEPCALEFGFLAYEKQPIITLISNFAKAYTELTKYDQYILDLPKHLYYPPYDYKIFDRQLAGYGLMLCPPSSIPNALFLIDVAQSMCRWISGHESVCFTALVDHKAITYEIPCDQLIN